MMPVTTLQDRYRGALMGLAVGDAVGTTLEFKARGTFMPITDMVGGGPFNLNPGEWTDDTSMALCLAASLVYRNGFDPRDQMNRYCNWAANGYMSSNGECFDIGNTVASALRRYGLSAEPFSGSTDPRSAGNGSLMRLAPVVLYFHPDREACAHYAGESSRTTHGAQEAVDACKIFAHMLCSAIDGAAKAELLQAPAPDTASERLKAIAAVGYSVTPVQHIRGSGYVVDALEAALWCFEKTNSFRDATLAAANLGDDADTTAAICGQIAGAYYGWSTMPASWREQVVMSGEILDLADALRASGA